MYFNVSQLIREPSGTRRSHNVDEAAVLGDDTLRRVTGSVELLRTDQGIWVSARLSSTITSTCGRCLTEYDDVIEMAIEEEYLPVDDAATGTRPSATDPGAEHFYIDRNHTLALTEAAQQYATMSTPMKPMCREDCPGFCFTCGTDLSQATCYCDSSPVDPRWSTLLEMVPADRNGS
jgi:uncharacterized protein